MSNTAYSKTPLLRKLGIKPGFACAFFFEPDHYLELLGPLPELRFLDSPAAGAADFVHCFVRNAEQLKEQAPLMKALLKPTGVLWVSWPKAASGITTDINRESVREALLATGLVDVKVASIDATWSGLKFVFRLKDR